MPFARSGGVRIHFEELGDRRAPAIVLLRGLARSARYWVDVHELLPQRFRVVMMDNRGVGRSDAPRPPYSTAAMADDVIAVMDAAGVPRAHVFGISLGGMIAQWVAARHPRRVDALILGCTTGGGRAGSGATLGASFALVRGGAMPFHDAMRYTAPYVVGPGFLRRRPEVVERWVELARAEPPPFAGLAGQLWAAARHDCGPHLGAIRARTLLLTGDEDRLIPAINSYRLLELIPRARLSVLDGAGHDFPTERPEETARAIGAFVGG